MIDEGEARRVATADAATAYRELSDYEVVAARGPDGWHVDFVLRDPDAVGGGPSYVIDADTGEVLQRRYAQ